MARNAGFAPQPPARRCRGDAFSFLKHKVNFKSNFPRKRRLVPFFERRVFRFERLTVGEAWVNGQVRNWVLRTTAAEMVFVPIRPHLPQRVADQRPVARQPGIARASGLPHQVGAMER